MKKAFTLIELLTVIAITAVLMTLIVLPIFQSFNVLRTAQAFADAQDKGRLLVERISREVGNAVSVRNIGAVAAQVPTLDANDRPTGTFTYQTLANTRIDIVPPAEGNPERRNGAYINPRTGLADPTLQRPTGDKNIPVRPGGVLVRWWVGLNRPTENYNEPYTGNFGRNGGRDNLYVLRRAEVMPFVWRLRKDGQQNSYGWRPNLQFFRSNDPIEGATDFDREIIDLDDPYFFVRDGQYLNPQTGNREPDPFVSNENPGKDARVDNWARVSLVATEVSRYDMIRPVVAGSPPKVVKPITIVPLIQFRPTRVAATAAAGSSSSRPGEGADGIGQIGPDAYRTEQGQWSNAIVRYYPANYQVGDRFEIASSNQQGGVAVERGQASGDGLDTMARPPNNFMMFDLLTYEQMQARGDAYPFSAAADSAAYIDTLIPIGRPGIRWMNVEEMRRTFMPFRVLTGTGSITTGFPIDEVGNAAFTPRPAVNLPTVISSNGLTPVQASNPNPAVGDPNLANAPLSPVSSAVSTGNPYDVNRAYNRLWNTDAAYQGRVHRFLDLRFVPNQDGTFSPLCPVAQADQVRGFAFPNAQGGTTNRVKIVPGSEEVYAPDQTPGPNYGSIVRYSRTTSSNPGPNQYRIVYADLREPGGATVDYSILDLPAGALAGFNPQVYNPDNIVSAAIQPQYKAGYLQFCSDPNIPMPNVLQANGSFPTIRVKYRFSLNSPGDTFAVDHDTREVMQILLTVKNYPQSNVPNAQTITLKSTATLRNTLR